MPVVPRYNEQQVERRPLPSVRVPTSVPEGTFGEPSGFDLRGVDRAVTDIANRERDKANQIAYLDADSKAATLETKLLYDAQNGALLRRGKNAFGLPEEVGAAWQKGVSEIEKGLTTTEQKLAFRRSAASRTASLNEVIQRHVGGEMRAYDDQTTQSYVDNERSAALANFQNKERVDLSVARQKAAIADYARRNGLPSERVAELQGDAASKTHVGVIERMLANDQDLAAKEYYAKVKGEIRGDDTAHVDKSLEEGSARGESQRQADTILSKKGLTLTDAISIVRQIKDPKVRDLTEERVRRDFTERDNALREQRGQVMAAATNVIESTHDFNRIPPSLVSLMTVSERKELREYAQSLLKGTPPVTNWNQYYDLMSMGSSEATRDKFLKLNLVQYRNQLGDAEFKQLTELQTSLRKGENTAQDRIEAAHQIDQTIRRSLESAGINPNPKPGTDDAKRVDAFYQAFKTATTQHEQRTGKQPSEEEVRGIVDNLLVRHVTEHWYQSNGPRGFEMHSGDEMTLSIGDVPALERRKASDALHARGLAATDERVINLYRLKLSRMRSRGR